MYCKKSNPVVILLWNTLIVSVVFMLIDYINYGLINPGPQPYSNEIGTKILYTVLFAIAFAHLYNKTSRIWRPNSDEAFFYKSKVVDPADLCKFSFPKLLNGLTFSILLCAAILFSMWLTSLLIAEMYIYGLNAFHGVPEDGHDTSVFVGKIILAGVALEAGGKTEDDPDR